MTHNNSGFLKKNATHQEGLHKIKAVQRLAGAVGLKQKTRINVGLI
jgi:hypothetical protein